MRRLAVAGVVLCMACEARFESFLRPATVAEPTPEIRPDPPEVPPRLLEVPGLRGLTSAEYQTSVRVVLGLAESHPVERVGAFETSEGAAIGQLPPVAIEAAVRAAQAAVAEALGDDSIRTGLTTCTGVSRATDPCFEATIARVGRRAYRRPLTAEEKEQWLTLLRGPLSGVDGGSISAFDRLAAVMVGLLQSPQFLYRVEVGGTTDDAGIRRFGQFEMVSRLTHLLWAGPPDDVLLDRAEALEVGDDIQWNALVAELLADPRAQAGRRRFLIELLGADGLLTQEKNVGLFPQFAHQRAALRESMVRSAVGALERGGLKGLFTDEEMVVNDVVSGIVGQPTGGSGWASVRVPSRPGVLASPGFAAMHSYRSKTSPALRGLFVRKRLLCQPIAPPPAGVATMLPELSEPKTTRQLVAIHLTNASCAGCHSLMDPIAASGRSGWRVRWAAR